MPTFVSALQARSFSRPQTDVIIVLSDKLNDDRFNQACEKYNISVLDASEALNYWLRDLGAHHFSGRIPKTAMGRLLLGELLPGQYDQIIYIDGDTQINTPLEELEDFYVRPGKFLAALDYVSMRDILNDLPLVPYFNSGVLKFNREGWIGLSAFEYYKANSHLLSMYDQDALNAVAGDSLTLISSRWNFSKQFLHLLDRESPAIIHFTAHPKPWNGVFFPWTEAHNAVYKDVILGHQFLMDYSPGISFARLVGYKIRSIREKNSILRSPKNTKKMQKNITKLFSREYFVL
jgi:lipopolysaccharide biosynthesis glycosyltransferase